MKLVTVVGARPQFIKAAVVSRALTASGDRITERLVHTGQHFDANMSAVFFTELGIPEPSVNLGVGGGTHGKNTGRMIEGIERILLAERPDRVLVYGDTDSTLAAAVAAAKLHIPVAHVEAGLRSFNRAMPEEINRVLTDHASELLFAPTAVAVANLAAEGITEEVHQVGDVMHDAALHYAEKALRDSRILATAGVEHGGYLLATIHRPANTDSIYQMRQIVQAFAAASLPVVFPIHPRTRGRLATAGISMPANVVAIDPVGYLDMVMLEHHARLIVTDSGGVQKEAYFHRVPCVTVRDETEWTELVDAGVNRLVSSDWPQLARWLSEDMPEFGSEVPRTLYGDGHAGEAIVEILCAG